MNKITIEGELYSSKNSRRTFASSSGKIINIPSKKAKENEKKLSLELYLKKRNWEEFVREVEYPLCLGLYLYRKTRRLFDYTNITQQLFDMMVKNDYLPDDSMLYLQPVFLGWEVDKIDPRTELFLLAINKDYL